jgi:hypothetical protein
MTSVGYLILSDLTLRNKLYRLFYVRLLSRLMEMIHMMLYEEESKGLVDPRGYIHDGPRAVT